MFRPLIWISSLTLGMAFACDLAAGQTHSNPPKGDSRPAAVWKTRALPPAPKPARRGRLRRGNAGRRRDRRQRRAPTRTTTSRMVSPTRTSTSPRPKSSRSGFPTATIKIERQVTQDAARQLPQPRHVEDVGRAAATSWPRASIDNGNRTGTWIRWYRSVGEAELLPRCPTSNSPARSSRRPRSRTISWTASGRSTTARSTRSASGNSSTASGTASRSGGMPTAARCARLNFATATWTANTSNGVPKARVRVKETYQAGRKLAPEDVTITPAARRRSEGMYLFAKEVEQTPDDWWNCKLHDHRQERQGREARRLDQPGTPTASSRSKAHYEHDVQVGQFTWWHANGQKALEGRFDAGKQDGEWTWWYANGQKSIHGEYANGNPTGRWTWWKEDGKVAQSADLSHSEGVVIDMPRTLGARCRAAVCSKPPVRQPQR